MNILKTFSKILNVDTGKNGTVINIRDDGYENGFSGIYGYSKFDVKYDDGTTEKDIRFPFYDTSYPQKIADKRWKIVKDHTHKLTELP
eukprot:UN15099